MISVHSMQEHIFNVTMYITWALYAAIVLGLSANAPQYLDTLHWYVKVYVSSFLIYRFNPFRHVRFTELDSKIAFSAGVFLLGTTTVDLYAQYLTNKNVTNNAPHSVVNLVGDGTAAIAELL